MISNDRRQRTLQDSIVEVSRDLLDGDVDALRAHLASAPESVGSVEMVECLVGTGQMLFEQFSVLLGTTSSRPEALRLLPAVMDTAADNMALGAATRPELGDSSGAVGVAAALIECVQFGTTADIADLLDAARCEFADIDILCAAAAFSAALTAQVATAYSLPAPDVHEQFFGPTTSARSMTPRACRTAPRVAMTVPVASAPVTRAACTLAASSSLA